jgi:hypothetical protein
LRTDLKQKIQNHFSGNYQTFYSKYLKDVKKAGGSEYQALCPFHEDGNPDATKKGTPFISMRKLMALTIEEITQRYLKVLPQTSISRGKSEKSESSRFMTIRT